MVKLFFVNVYHNIVAREFHVSNYKVQIPCAFLTDVPLH